MEFLYDVSAALPRLAWLATLERNVDTVVVQCGSWVETRPGWFCEAAWDGEFAKGEIAQARFLVGSGGCLDRGGVVFATPSQTIDRLHLVRRGGRLWISNSLPLVLAASGEQCDESYRYYFSDFSTIKRGIHDYKADVPTASGNRVHLYYFCNVAISPDLQVRKVSKPEAPAFKDFAAYRAYLVDTVKAIAGNATDGARKVKYRLMSTISSGYDSPACSVIAKEAGCVDAVTFVASAPRRGMPEDDSGKPIGDILQFTTLECDRDDYLRRQDSPEVEFLASGTGGSSAMWASVEEALERRILITGDHGDTVWDPKSPRVSTLIKRGDPGSCTVDFRARVGYLVLALPFIGITRHPEIHRISNSPEMQPWSVDRSYNRPIARRIVEEAGVPGNLFGQEKKVIAQAFHPLTGEHDPLETMLSPASLDKFNAYFAAAAGNSNRARLGSVVLESLFALNARMNWKLRGIARRLGFRFAGFKLIDERHRVRLMPHDFTFHWANRIMVDRYRSALKMPAND